MTSRKKSVKAALTRGRDTAVRAGKVAKSATLAAVKAGSIAGAKAAADAGSLELKRGWKASSPAQVKKRTRNKIVGALAGAAALVAVGVAVARARGAKKK